MNEKYPLALPAGTVLAGQYIVEDVLGQGGFGITYEAKDYKTEKKVAVKEYFPDTMATRTTANTVIPYSGDRGENFSYGKTCFLQEAETLANFIGNENIVRIYSYFEENDTAYFVMEFIDGISFDEYLKQQGGKVSFEQAAKILVPIMDALEAVHARGIIHRDVSPDNICLTRDGGVKLLDFGAARYSLGDQSRSLDVILKHGFAPKEQYIRRGRQGPYTDIYALGATFYFALTGRRPPDSVERMDEDDLVPPSTLGVKISPAAEDAILKALNVQPADRFQHMADFKEALLDSQPLDLVQNPAAEEAGHTAPVEVPVSSQSPVHSDAPRSASLEHTESPLPGGFPEHAPSGSPAAADSADDSFSRLRSNMHDRPGNLSKLRSGIHDWLDDLASPGTPEHADEAAQPSSQDHTGDSASPGSPEHIKDSAPSGFPASNADSASFGYSVRTEDFAPRSSPDHSDETAQSSSPEQAGEPASRKKQKYVPIPPEGAVSGETLQQNKKRSPVKTVVLVIVAAIFIFWMITSMNACMSGYYAASRADSNDTSEQVTASVTSEEFTSRYASDVPLSNELYSHIYSNEAGNQSVSMDELNYYLSIHLHSPSYISSHAV